MVRRAHFDASRRYRYRLDRVWDRKRPRVTFILLNPSTADESVDDPTLRRCVGLARSWGFGGLIIVNLFAWRARNPAALRVVRDPIGPRNDSYIRSAVKQSDCVVAGWGVGGDFRGRESDVRAMIGEVPLHRLGLTRNGQPRHPLYVPASVTLQRV